VGRPLLRHIAVVPTTDAEARLVTSHNLLRTTPQQHSTPQHTAPNNAISEIEVLKSHCTTALPAWIHTSPPPSHHHHTTITPPYTAEQCWLHVSPIRLVTTCIPPPPNTHKPLHTHILPPPTQTPSPPPPPVLSESSFPAAPQTWPWCSSWAGETYWGQQQGYAACLRGGGGEGARGKTR